MKGIIDLLKLVLQVLTFETILFNRILLFSEPTIYMNLMSDIKVNHYNLNDNKN